MYVCVRETQRGRTAVVSPAVPSRSRHVRKAGPRCLPRPDCSVDSECHYQHCLHTSAVVASQRRRRGTVCRLERRRRRRRRGVAGDGAVICAVSLHQRKDIARVGVTLRNIAEVVGEIPLRVVF